MLTEGAFRTQMKQFIDSCQQQGAMLLYREGGKKAGHHIVKPPFDEFLLVSFVIWVNGKIYRLQGAVKQ